MAGNSNHDGKLGRGGGIGRGRGRGFITAFELKEREVTGTGGEIPDFERASGMRTREKSIEKTPRRSTRTTAVASKAMKRSPQRKHQARKSLHKNMQALTVKRKEQEAEEEDTRSILSIAGGKLMSGIFGTRDIKQEDIEGYDR